MPKYDSMQERIIANSVVAPDGPVVHGERCWLWLGKTRQSNRGSHYPAITRRISKGPRKGNVVNETTTRVVVKVFKNKRLSRRQVVMHLCNNSICVNPAHLVGGTQKKNVRQTVRDGRHSNGRAKADPHVEYYGQLYDLANWPETPELKARIDALTAKGCQCDTCKARRA